MTGRSAALRSRHARSWDTRRIFVTLALGAMSTLNACGLVPAPPSPTPSAPQTSTRPDSPSPAEILPAGDPTQTAHFLTATSAHPTAAPKEHSTSTTQADRAEPTPTAGVPRLTPTIRPTATHHPPAPTPQPSATPTSSSTPPATARSDISVSTEQVTLLTYPYHDFLRAEQDTLYGMTVQHLERAAYEAAAPNPSPRNYQTLVIENAFLRLTFLPELGGRLYSVILKSTGQEVFYHNPVIKPSRYGPLLPIEDNWWLAVGGMEWAFPVQEHGYAWGQPWTYEVSSTPQNVTVTLQDSTQAGRVRAEVRVILPAYSATFSIQPRLINGSDHTMPVQFWLSAALAPGATSVVPDTRIIVPVNQVVVHSRGETGWQLPGPRSPMPWPVAGNQDLSRYDQWSDYLGFFAPYMQASFMAVYNPGADVGISRIVSAGQIPGHKIFAFGLNFGDRSYTEGNSQYLEMWGGANPSFWPEDDIQLAPGDAIEWRETWWPLAGLGGLTFANEQVAFNLLHGSSLRILGARSQEAILIVSADGVELSRTSLDLHPSQPAESPIPGSSSPSLRIQLITPDGVLMADYQTSLPLAGTSL